MMPSNPVEDAVRRPRGAATLSPLLMKRITVRRAAFLLAALLLAVTSPAVAQGRPAPLPVGEASADEQQLLDLSKTKWRWMAEQKSDTLAALFDHAAVFVHMGGAWGAAQEVDIIRSGGIHYKHAEIFDASARIIGTTGIVLNRIRLDAVVGGNEVSNPFIVTEVYVRQNGAWKLASLSFTRLAGQ